MPSVGGTRRRPTHPKLRPVIGRHATKNPPVRQPRVVLAAVLNRSLLLRRVRTMVVRVHPVGIHKTKNPPVRRPVVILARQRPRAAPHTFLRQRRAVAVAVVVRHVRAILTSLQSVQRTARRVARITKLSRPKGYATRNPPIRRVRVVGQAVLARTWRRPGRARFLRAFGKITGRVPVRAPRVLRAWLARTALRPATRSRLRPVKGYITRKPPIRRPTVLRAQARPRFRLATKLGRPRRFVAAIARRVAPIRVRLAALRPRARTLVVLRRSRAAVVAAVARRVQTIRCVRAAAVARGAIRSRTHPQLMRPRGYPTRRPPVRRPMVLGFCSRLDRRPRRFVSRTTRTHVFGSSQGALLPVLSTGAGWPPGLGRVDDARRRRRRAALLLLHVVDE
jgi:hypothetical protein